jgi:hypothetical protein
VYLESKHLFVWQRSGCLWEHTKYPFVDRQLVREGRHIFSAENLDIAVKLLENHIHAYQFSD